MIHLTQEAENLAQRLAEARGISVESAVQVALEEISKNPVSVPSSRSQLDKEELIERMEEISARSGARTLIDPRSPDELLGYDEYGLPG